MEDLDENPLYRALLTKFQREFEIACKMSCIIAISKSESLQDVEIDQFLVNSHILMPSKLLKMHFTPLQVGHYDDIEIEGRKLIVYANKKKPLERFTVNILAEEVGYNSSNKEFKTLLIDRPLIATKTRPLIRSILSPTQTKFNSLRTRPPKPLTNHEDCSKYLESISQKLTIDLESDVKRLQNTYLFLSQYLDDAARKIQDLVEDYVSKYKLVLFGQNESSLLFDSVKHAIELSVENYVIHLIHGKLLASIHSQHERDDRILMEKFIRIGDSRLTICQLGAQSAFGDFILTEELIRELRRLPYHQSPLAIVSSLIKVVELISEGLNQSVKFRNLMGDGNYSKDKVSICSDDLIASFVYSLAQAKPDYLYSISKYLDTFSWSSSARDQAAYYTATFQIVIQYIMSFSSTKTMASEGVSPPARLQINARQLDIECSHSKSMNTNRFVDSLETRLSSDMDPDSSTSSVSSGLKAEWEVI